MRLLLNGMIGRLAANLRPHNRTLSNSGPSNLSSDPSSRSVSLFSSAPSKVSSFPAHLVERHEGQRNSFDQRNNVEDGMQSLFRGMNAKGVEEEDLESFNLLHITSKTAPQNLSFPQT